TNEWFARQARLELTARAEMGQDLKAARSQLLGLFENDAGVVVKLRSLWSLYAMGKLDEGFLRAQLRHENEHVRAWAIRLLTDAWPLDTMMSRRPGTPPAARRSAAEIQPNPREWEAAAAEFRARAKADPSGLVRLALASTLQRLPVEQRPALAAALLMRDADAQDHNLPLLIWYGLIPVADEAPSALVPLAVNSQLPLTRTLIARRLAEDIEKNPAPLNDLIKLTAAQSRPVQSDILNGMADGLIGWRMAKKPAAWDALAARLADAPDVVLRDRVRDLSVLFGDG